MDIVAISSVWNNALWVESQLRQLLPLVSKAIIVEANWTSDDSRWAGDTSPDGTAALIRSFPDPDHKIEFYQLGRWQNGCLAARAELASRIPLCDLVWVCDFDEFHTRAFHEFLLSTGPSCLQVGYTTFSQNVRSFYFDFTRHTIERFTRLFKWYPGINPWFAHYEQPRDFDVAREFNQDVPDPDEPGMEIFHASYVPVPGVEIKGAQSFDTSLEKYQDWYRNVLSRFDGRDLGEVYRANGDSGGVHVFGGCPLFDYMGKLPEALQDHPLARVRWDGKQYRDRKTKKVLDLKGWWNGC